MPKDDENILLPLVGPTTPSEPVGFSPGDMIRCEQCLRANPPTRVACFYCGATLPVTESSARLRKPALMSPDKLEPGYNIIFAGWDQTGNRLGAAADLLKLATDALEKLFSLNQRLPLARTATFEEAQLACERLTDLGVKTLTVSDDELGISEKNVIRARSVVFDDSAFLVKPTGGAETVELNYADLLLLMQARLLTKTTAVKERQSRSTENEILETSEFYADESVLDIYASSHEQTWRISANSFDFSCLGERKALIVNANMSKLAETFASKAPHVVVDNSYNTVRQLLELVWGSEKATKSDGWRRDGPGRVIVGATMTHSNEKQFTRYSRLRYYFRSNNH